MTIYLPSYNYFDKGHQFSVSCAADDMAAPEFRNSILRLQVDANPEISSAWVAPDETLLQAVLDAMAALVEDMAGSGHGSTVVHHQWTEPGFEAL